ncbi:MAG TPA: SpoIIE family protein phosphatase [Chloroflexaceae bacterium]|nr:SpoIIE family protein phosphatase [Chloroflexaceae bacterium]
MKRALPMATLIQQFRRALRRGEAAAPVAAPRAPAAPDPDVVRELDLAANDPLLALLQSSSGVLDLATLRLESPMVTRLRAEGVRLLVPLLSQGELVGMLSLGPRRSEQDYASDDKALLVSLATQAAPALRVAQLVRQQRAEARERERIAQELRVARLIQQTLLPREVPAVPGWGITPYYEPAREVGGDFYDFIPLADGRLGLVIADVTDKGVPAALVMATTRSVLRAAATRLEAPGSVLARVNDMLVPDIPPNMFVTCFYAILDPESGRLRFANAGHDVPYWRGADGAVRELRARGMPLGLMEGMAYEEGEVRLGPGDHLLLYSDGLVEAHNPRREMFSFERLSALVGGAPRGGQPLVDALLAELARFTGEGWVQEDDITLVTLACEALPAQQPEDEGGGAASGEPGGWRTLAELELPSAPDNERLAMEQVAEAVGEVGLPPLRLERLKTAVAEATMNAMEHGNGYRADRPTRISVRRTADTLSVRIFDHGAGPAEEPAAPDLEAKLEGLQTPRGWGLHLIRHMVDELHVGHEDGMHVIELVVKL